MILQLWGSWLVLFIIARVLGALAMLALVFGLALLPGNKAKRFEALMAHNGRNMFLLVLLAIVVALVGVYFVSQWWFTMIDFSPVGVAVFGSVGIAAITWITKFLRNRKQLSVRVEKVTHDHEHDEH